MPSTLNRPSLLANLPRVLAHLSKQRPHAAAGQTSLFGDVGAAEAPFEYVELPDYSTHEKLWHERRVLGAFVSGHPLESFQGKLGACTHKCRESYDMLQSGGARIVVAGLIRQYTRAPRIGFITLEDETGVLEAVIFNDEAERFAAHLADDMIVALKLKPRFDNDRSSLQVLQVHRFGRFGPFGEAPVKGKKKRR